VRFSWYGNFRSLIAAVAALAAIAVIATGSVARAQTPEPSPGSSTASSQDPYLWLEDVDGERAMSWVHAENAKTVAVLEADARYETLHK
jgi:prolyl oligopeptidase